ncbi:MAG: hypothetical protein A2756_01565 [Candidatus Ryanbacteria bacterium RIFCSPHIGHO2_01_FULL_48_27]|uniref:Rieske domain-containing protein n=1 Tax=Candidatus Ryanbacteria bacterium RIFCSPHIGHO2_01_FULL_48_27 TaxID=1802115 RepID=A0A1G2G5R5_9BACT|nr:MAG: hypothetical protein A2756_01565 [Candidatus Ryanbacteria bacterium RIFCSPHIGHO2_01_FULL_48_27]
MEAPASKQSSFWLNASPDAKKFPVLETNLKSDVVIVGGGMIGVCTAVYLANQGISVILLEKNHIASGDTALSTGFLTRVPDTILSRIRQTYGADFLREILEVSRAAQKKLFDEIERNSLMCDFTRTESYFGAYHANDLMLADEIAALDGIDVGALVWQSPVGPFARAIKFLQEGKCNARQLLVSMLEREKNNPHLVVYEETEIRSIVVSDLGVLVRAAGGLVEAGRVVVTTGLPHVSFAEARALVREKISHVVVARYTARPPIPDALFWDTASPYFYYRLVAPHMLMLGGCDTFVDAPSDPKRRDPLAELELFLKSRLPGDHEIVYSWSGGLFETKDGLPYVFEHPQYPGRVFIACGFGGNGLVMGKAAAYVLGDLVQGKKTRAALLFGLERTGEVLSLSEAKNNGETIRQKIFVRVATIADVIDAKPYCAEARGHKIALFLIGGKYYAISNTCSHAGGSLCRGTLTGDSIQCPVHGAKFNVATGAVMGPPALRPQLTYPVRVRGRDVEVEVEVEMPKGPAVQDQQSHTRIQTAGSTWRSWLRRFF